MCGMQFKWQTEGPLTLTAGETKAIYKQQELCFFPFPSEEKIAVRVLHIAVRNREMTAQAVGLCLANRSGAQSVYLDLGLAMIQIPELW